MAGKNLIDIGLEEAKEIMKVENYRRGEQNVMSIPAII